MIPLSYTIRVDLLTWLNMFFKLRNKLWVYWELPLSLLLYEEVGGKQGCTCSHYFHRQLFAAKLTSDVMNLFPSWVRTQTFSDRCLHDLKILMAKNVGGRSEGVVEEVKEVNEGFLSITLVD